MLPECELSVLNNLPPYVKRIAMNVCSRYPSASALHDMDLLVKTLNSCPDDDLKFFLPLCYTLLDPLRLPTADHYDPAAVSAETALHIHLTVLLLPAILINPVMSTTAEISAVMWPRFWAWVLFLHRNHAVITHIPAADRSETLLYTTILGLVGPFCSFPSIKVTVFASPEVLFVCAKGWKRIPYARWSSSERARTCCSHMHDLLVDHQVAPVDISSFIPILLEATGGTFEDLVKTILNHFKHTPDTMSEEGHVEFPGRSLCLIIRLSPKVHERLTSNRLSLRESNSRSLCPLFTALVSGGLVPVLLRILSTICETGLRFGHAWQTLQQALFVLTDILLTPVGSAHLATAIRCGLIHSVFKIATSPLGSRLESLLVQFVVDLIPINLHRFGVVAALEKEMNAINKLIPATADQAEKAFTLECWEHIEVLLDARISLHDQYSLGIKNKLRMCANMKCGRICTKIELKRCSHCKTFVYCSRDCQSLDWREGRHRTSCGAYRSAYLDAYGTNLTSRDMSFLRFQLDHELSNARSRIVAKQVSALARGRSGQDLIVTRFKYTSEDGALEIDAVPYSEIQ
ncbi:hypothetical protein C8F01DRAFT_1238675, partial [Mycena amicta]